jgi:hypothetical protein
VGLSPALIDFLNNLLKTKKRTRKINIPSGHNDVAAVLVFTTCSGMYATPSPSATSLIAVPFL